MSVETIQELCETYNLQLDPAFKAQWVAALRSGAYSQGVYKLYDASDETYCCLGVACRLTGLDRGQWNEHADSESPDDAMAERWGLASSRALELFDALAMLNDEEGFTFDQIATVIENYL